jgi:hypothetical protein
MLNLHKPIRSSVAIVCLCLTPLSWGAPPPDVITKFTGKLSVRFIDDFAGNRSEVQHILEDAHSKRRHRLRFNGEPPPGLRNGDKISVRGRLKNGELYPAANGDGSGSYEVLTPAATVSGEQRVLVMLANFSDANVGCDRQSVQDRVFTDPQNQSIADYYNETSQGAVTLTGAAVGPFTISASKSSCNIDGWADAVDAQARAAGTDPANYERRVYLMPTNSCAGAGYGDLGGSNTRAWSFYCGLSDLTAHELGHNLGMMHATTPGSEYGDHSDIMGQSGLNLRHVNAPHKDQMGWISGAQIQQVNAAGTYDVAPLASPSANAVAPQVLKIPLPTAGEYLYLSYRQAIGFDGGLNASKYQNQVSIHSHRAGSSTNTVLQSVLSDGESYLHGGADVSITQLNHSETYATVQVAMTTAEPQCTPSASSFSVSTTLQEVSAGATATYTARLSNQDSADCQVSNYSLQLSHDTPELTASLSTQTLALQPGESASVTVTVGSTSTLAAGSYGLVLSASDSTDTATANLSYRVVSDPDLSGPDLDAPSAPSGLSANAKRKQVALAWNVATDNVAVTGYRVWRNGSYIGQTGSNAYTDRSANLKQSNSYEVAAVDGAGNESALSEPANTSASSGTGGGKSGNRGKKR